MISELTATGFPGLLPLITTSSGSPYLRFDDQYFILTRWVEGAHPDLTNAKQRQAIAQLYARLHRTASKISSVPEPDRPDWWTEYSRRTVFLKSLKRSIPLQKKINRTDRTILSWVDHFHAQAEFAIQGLLATEFACWSRLPAVSGFCHNDPAPHNIIMERNWFLIDYELTRNDLFIREFVTLALRTLRENGWKGQVFKELFESYVKEREIAPEEARSLPYLLAFPHAFWRLCSQRFEEKLAWSEHQFASKMWQLATTEQARLSFLNEVIPELSDRLDCQRGGTL